MAILKLGHVLLPTGEMDATVRFYTDVLDMPVRFRDGDNYTALQCGDGTLALVGPRERPAGRGVAPAVKVDDLDGLVKDIEKAGRGPVEIREGPHERSVEVQDPAGNPLVFYASR